MLSTLLSQLQGYFSKYFLVGSFSPMLAFTFINGAGLYFILPPWRSWADANIVNATATGGAFLMSSLVVGIVLASYVLSSIGNYMRQQLEGQWTDGLADLLRPTQSRRYRELVARRNKAGKDVIDLRESDKWEVGLSNARQAGRTNHPGVVAPPDPQIEGPLSKLERDWDRHATIDVEQLKSLVDLLKKRLEGCDVNQSPAIEGAQQRLSALIAYAVNRARAYEVRLINELHSNFGTEIIAPTKMGNVANTTQGYVLRRYGCNLEPLWTNLMQIVQNDDKSYAMLMETKTQLDFLVASCWLTLLSTGIWIVITFEFFPTRWGFLASAVVGPLIAYCLYWAAIEQYRTFADVSMTMFDSFRFDLLQRMRLAAPADVAQERLIWGELDNLMTGDEGGYNFRYEAPAPSAPKPTAAPKPAADAKPAAGAKPAAE